MSLTQPGWYEEVVYKDLVMMRKLGYSSVLQDGGFSCLTGVDYTGGQARPVQPYYWRFYQDVAQLGMDLNGECMTGWGNNNLGTPKPEDMKALWALVHTMYRGNRDGAALQWHTPEFTASLASTLRGLLSHLSGAPGNAVVARFAQKFLRENGHPDRVSWKGCVGTRRHSSGCGRASGGSTRDGKRVRYPDYAEVTTQN